MKRYSRIVAKTFLCSCIVGLLCGFVALIAPGCSPTEEKAVADAHPVLKSTTQTSEKVQAAIDPYAQKGEVIAKGVAGGANVAAGIGIPYAGTLGVIAGLIGTALGTYNERRKGTIPLGTAATTLANAWHDEGSPGASPAMQSALNTIESIAPAAAKLINAALPTAKSS